MNVKRITIEQYEAMTDAWARTGRLGDVAAAGNVSADVAKKIVADGHDDYPSIRARVDKLRTIHMEEEDTRRAEETRVARAATRKILHDNVTAVRSMRLVPNGRAVLQPDGTTIFECDETTYSKVLTALEKVVSLRDTLDGKTQRPSVGVGVQVNVDRPEHTVTPVPQSSPEDTKRQAEALMREYLPAIEELYGDDENLNERIVSELARVARSRIGDGADPEDDSGDS